MWGVIIGTLVVQYIVSWLLLTCLNLQGRFALSAPSSCLVTVVSRFLVGNPLCRSLENISLCFSYDIKELQMPILCFILWNVPPAHVYEVITRCLLAVGLRALAFKPRWNSSEYGSSTQSKCLLAEVIIW